jgi:hypothetical protein
MKKIVLFVALSLVILQSFSQDTTTRVLTKSEYLKKSRSAKTTGWILVGSGLGMAIGSAATFQLSFGPVLGGSSSSSQEDNTASTLLAIGATGAIVGSIIAFSTAKKYKKLAATVSIHTERIPTLQQYTFGSRTQPTVHIRIPF